MTVLKPTISLATLLALLAIPCLAQDWTPNWQYRSKAHHVKFLNANTGYMSFTPHSLIPDNYPVIRPTYGLMLKTNDGGLNWSQQKFDSLPGLFTMDFADTDHGFMTGQGIQNGTSTILKTNNGGQSWTKKTVAGIQFDDLDMIDNQNIMILGQKVSGVVASQDSSILMQSTNGGVNWLSRKLGFSASHLHFVDAHTGFVAGRSGKIHKTTNAGSSWAVVYSSADMLSELHFTSPQTGYAISQNGKVISTTNGGIGWSVYNLGSYNLKSIRFFDNNQGYVCAAGTGAESELGYVFKTTNAGSSWSQSLAYNTPLTSIDFGSATHGYAIGDHGHLIRTSNSGQNWTPLMGLAAIPFMYNTAASDIHFPTNNTGYIIGQISTNIYLSKTTNGGQSWLSTYPLGLQAPVSDFQFAGIIKSVFFTDSLVGYVCGINGRIFKTTNGGQSWQTQTSNFTHDFMDIKFVSATTGYIVGGLRTNMAWVGVILKTTNAGQTWAIINTQPDQLLAICLVGPQIGYVSGHGGVVLKTIDAGQIWQPILPLQAFSIKNISFTTPDEGFAVFNHFMSEIRHTTDGGASWESIEPATYRYRFGALECNGNGCYLLGFAYYDVDNQPLTKSVVLRNNGAASAAWVSESYSVPYDNASFIGIAISPNQTAHAVDLRGMAIKKFDQLTSVKPKTTPARQTIAFDIFPNPNSGLCTLETQNHFQTSLVIMDVLGRIIQSGELAGRRTALKLRRGIYFVRLQGPAGQGMQRVVVVE